MSALLILLPWSTHRQIQAHEVGPASLVRLAVMYAAIGVLGCGAGLLDVGGDAAPYIALSGLLSIGLGFWWGAQIRVWCGNGSYFTQGTPVMLALWASLIVGKIAINTVGALVGAVPSTHPGEIFLFILRSFVAQNLDVARRTIRQKRRWAGRIALAERQGAFIREPSSLLPTRSLATLACLALLALTVSQASDASAAGLRSGRLVTGMAAITAPRAGAVVVGPGVRVRVRAAPGTSLRAWLDRREVTRAFARAGALGVATLRAPLGVNHLYVRVRDGRGRRDFDAVRFVRAGRAPGLLSVSRHPRRARRGGLAVGVLLARGADVVHGTLNGHRLGSALGSGRRRALVLDADDGLRFGPNRLVVTALDEAGGFDVERRMVRLSRTRPIPGAGHPRRVRVGHVVGLDGTRSRAARRGGRLAFRWTIVRTPKGSRARLRYPLSARPRLRPDKDGTYRLRLDVTGRPPRPGFVAASTHSFDTVTIQAAPDVLPLGVPIDTVSGKDSTAGVRLGAPVNETFLAPDPTKPLQLVVLDRATLELQDNESYTGDEAGTSALLARTHDFTSTSLVIIATPDSSNSQAIDNDQTALDTLNTALEDIGAVDLDQRLATNPFCYPQDNCSNFSAIGVPELSTNGGGTENPGLNLAPNGDTYASVRGDLRGYLEVDSAGNFTYVNTDWVPFNTVAAGTTPTQAVITVGGDTYQSRPLGAGQGGFFVLILDAGMLTYRNAQTFPITGVDQLTASNSIASMEALLATAAGDGSQLVFIQTIGSTSRIDFSANNAAAIWTQVSADQQLLGGDAFWFNAIDASQNAAQGTYAFLGPGEPLSSPSPDALTASPETTGGSGQLTGWLARDTRSQFSARGAGPDLSLDLGLPAVAYRRPSAWPDRDTPGHLAALACVGAAVNPPLSTPIESHYQNLNLNWSSYAGTVQALSLDKLGNVPACQGSGFTASDFSDVQSQLYDEWSDLATLSTFVANLKSPLTYNNNSVQGHVNDVTQDVENAIPGAGGQATSNAAQLVTDTFWIASYIPAVGDGFGVAAAILQLGLDTANGQNGSPSVGNLQAAVSALPDKLGTAYATAYASIDQIGALVATDWGKLSTVAARAANQWAWTTADTYQSADAFDAAMTKLAYEALVPTAFQYYRFGDQVVHDAGAYQCALITPLAKQPSKFNPFAGEWNGGQANITGGGPTTDLVALGQSDTSFLSARTSRNTTLNGAVPTPLMQAMFETTTPTTFGTVQNETPLPSPSRFEEETYGTRHVITHPAPGYCLVDGNNP